MELLEIAKKRFSVRNYTNQKVEPEKLAKILEAAHVAPTAANLQPVHLIVAQSDEASILTDHMMLQATELGLGSVWVCYFKPDVLSKAFHLPANLEPINILAIGYSAEGEGDPNRFAAQRIPMDKLVSYDML